ncbi:hypothetical protein OESDEN_16332 [Oesophagostomum dentatum]|uniref:Uncharacterized protein n=1 Tax=Oesophagostomum dentatum TaxID=61180 RepID=A0A0B1SL52_OESDE|nr:hypothetical protein OESDEN_16332 [Oesophagostomum dentatum]
MLTDIEFLRDFRFMPHESCQSVIRGNKHLCVSKELEQHLGRQMNLLIGENMDTSCRKG